MAREKKSLVTTAIPYTRNIKLFLDLPVKKKMTHNLIYLLVY
jgi:hypothetical protein